MSEVVCVHPDIFVRNKSQACTAKVYTNTVTSLSRWSIVINARLADNHQSRESLQKAAQIIRYSAVNPDGVWIAPLFTHLETVAVFEGDEDKL